MKNVIKKSLATFLQLETITRNKKLVKKLMHFSKLLPTSFKLYEFETTITFHLTTQEQNVNHAKIPELFGIARERFGLDNIPNFKTDIGTKYLLKTRTANYQYLKDFYFGEKMTIKMFVADIDDVSFTLIGLFFSDNTLKTIAEQKIIYANMNNLPERMPTSFKNVIESALIPLEKFLN
jgi:acyl-CoA thioesterase FadM